MVYEQTIAELEKCKYEDLPPLKNPPKLEAVDDLTNLSYLHEAAVLHSVKIRYLQKIIYTYSGLVLIAMNPFKKMNIYGSETMRQYAGSNRDELEPHLFAIAEEAYRKMINEGMNQSVIVSGESGAGKTMTAKYVMKYFAVVDELMANTGRASVEDRVANNSSVEDAVLSTNPIMEAFGNAKTTRNDNSSRFGKYIEILFKKKKDGSDGYMISGARMRTYLLERSRLTFQPESERNYHIFYQLCAACPAAEKKQLGLDSWNHFSYMSQGKTGVIKGTDDAEEFIATQKGMSTVGISVSTQWDIFRICAALLHIGNIKIEDQRGNAKIEESDPALILACKLLMVDEKMFHKTLVKKQITARGETIVSDAKYAQSITARDSIAKYVYSLLFDWIVKSINKKLGPPSESIEDDSDDSVKEEERFIGVLDIYGFEHFQKNSFEQFCINFANEKLQQEFTRHVFKLEQQEYVAEQIQWSFIDFNDNQPCIEMIEGKLGIMDLLDEESRLPSGADKSLILKLYKRFGGEDSKFFVKPRFGEVEFIVKHYALDVSYQIDGFLEKNKDTVTDEQLLMLNDTKCEILKDVVKITPENSAGSGTSPKPGARGAPKKATLGSIFKGSLIKLMETLRKTNPHFIRCIKPNQAKKAFEFEPQNVLGQLVACGVLETIKISRAGYPSKQTFENFVNRYYFLVPSIEWRTNPKNLTEVICSKHLRTGNFEPGLTKVFFRAGQLALLEKIRSQKFTDIVILIQKNVCRGFYRKRYLKTRNSIVFIQKSFREHIARKRAQELLEYNTAVKIQAMVRGKIQHYHYQNTLEAVKIVQIGYRRYVDKRDRVLRGKQIAASKIAATWKMFKQRQMYRKDISDIIKTQSVYRRKIARREFKTLRMEAKSVGKLQETNFKLDRKVFELSQSLDLKKQEVAELSKSLHSMEEQLNLLKEKYSKLKATLRENARAREFETSKVFEDLKLVREERDELLKMSEMSAQMLKKRDDHLQNLQEEKLKLDTENAALKEKLRTTPKDDVNTEALQKEVANLREQMSKLISGKYKTDQNTEIFMNNNTPAKQNSAQQSTAARMSMSFFESAAQVTARVAGSLNLSSDTLETQEVRPLQVRPFDYPDDSLPRDVYFTDLATDSNAGILGTSRRNH